jgi:hypothetical protein
MESQSKSSDLPRFTELPAFDPHRKSFECKHEDAANPPINSKAQELFEQAQARDDWHLTVENASSEGRAKIAADMAHLYGEAMKLGHWKAQYNLATMYLDGYGVPRNGDEALRLTEDLMKQGIPAAWDLMGTLYMNGAGPLKADPTVAYAFWQRAADMGSMRAQTFLGEKLDADHDEPPTFWGNQVIGRKMLECAHAQGSGEAAYELGVSLNHDGRAASSTEKAAAAFSRALQVLHEGVKFGSQLCAGYLESAFRSGDALVGNAKDPSRSERYEAISDRMHSDRHLKLPNLDKVLPLPPAQLPKWDSKPDSLIDAAKGVRVIPKLPQSSSNLFPTNHRAHQPFGTTLAVPPHLANIPTLPGFTSVLADSPGSTGLARALIGGYWQAKALPGTAQNSPYVSSLRRAFGNVPPLRFEEGERMQLTIDNSNLPHEDIAHSLVTWHFAGWSAPMHEPQDWLAKAGSVRAIDAATDIGCPGDRVCIATGIWQPYVLDEAHPMHALFGTALFTDAWKWQAFVQEGHPMPSLQAMGLPLEDAQVDWRLMQRTALGFDV